jgi:glycine/D-amino acid oxidase-like deaminating enzyme
VTKTSGTVGIVGAGIFGATAALELRKRGWHVTLFDPGPLPHPDASSTDVSKVVRMDYGADRFYHEFADAALAVWDEWNAAWPSPLYHEDGFLILSAGPMKPGSFEHNSWQMLQDRGHDPLRLDPADMHARFPAWAHGRYVDGYLSRRAGWAESGAVLAHVLDLCMAKGVHHVAEGARPLEAGGARSSSVVTRSGSVHDFDTVIVAAGAWTPTLVPWLSEVLWATAQPVLHFGVENSADFKAPHFPPWAADTSGSGWYGFPALDDGRVKVGHHGAGRRVHPGERGTVGDDHVARCRAFLSEALPSLADAPVVYRRVCLYCDSFDGDFLIDADPDHPGLVVASGGSGHGFKFAPLLGPLIADVVEGRDNPWRSRFVWRSSGEHRTEEARFDG